MPPATAPPAPTETTAPTTGCNAQIAPTVAEPTAPAMPSASTEATVPTPTAPAVAVPTPTAPTAPTTHTETAPTVPTQISPTVRLIAPTTVPEPIECPTATASMVQHQQLRQQTTAPMVHHRQLRRQQYMLTMKTRIRETYAFYLKAPDEIEERLL